MELLDGNFRAWPYQFPLRLLGRAVSRVKKAEIFEAITKVGERIRRLRS